MLLTQKASDAEQELQRIRLSAMKVSKFFIIYLALHLIVFLRVDRRGKTFVSKTIARGEANCLKVIREL